MTGSNTTGAALALLLAAAISGCATGFGGNEEPRPDLSLYDTWDTDRNGMLDENEFGAGSAESLGDLGDFAAWDADRNGAVSEDEFYGEAYDVWDADDDDLLSEAEFGAGTDAWLGDSDRGDFADWDADGSGGLDDNEFYDGWGL